MEGIALDRGPKAHMMSGNCHETIVANKKEFWKNTVIGTSIYAL